MELELSLGDSPAAVKAAITPNLVSTCTGEGHELVLGLGVSCTMRAEQNSQRTTIGTHQEEAVEGDDDDEACPPGVPTSEVIISCPDLGPASAHTRSVDSEVCTLGFDVNNTVEVEVPVRKLAAYQEASEDEENGGGRVRKKLRLSKEQYAFLEDSFKEHSTLTMEQKSNLANRLSLRPRQVEVWFQNRRARTKLKQTEVECEHLKRCCETLTQENRRLRREVAELRPLRPTTYPLCNLPGVVSTVLQGCPSCDSTNATTPSYYSPPAMDVTAAVSSPVGAASTATSAFFSARPHFAPITIHPVLRRRPSATS